METLKLLMSPLRRYGKVSNLWNNNHSNLLVITGRETIHKNLILRTRNWDLMCYLFAALYRIVF